LTTTIGTPTGLVYKIATSVSSTNNTIQQTSSKSVNSFMTSSKPVPGAAPQIFKKGMVANFNNTVYTNAVINQFSSRTIATRPGITTRYVYSAALINKLATSTSLTSNTFNPTIFNSRQTLARLNFLISRSYRLRSAPTKNIRSATSNTFNPTIFNSRNISQNINISPKLNLTVGGASGGSNNAVQIWTTGS
jgi:hypothetical protein